MNNAYLYLLSVSWKQAFGYKKILVFTYISFVFSNICIAINPVLLGSFFNHLQIDGLNSLKYAWIYGALYVLLYLLQYSFHGPARVYEKKIAFIISKNLLEDLFAKVLSLPINWHKNNHSGITLNRIRKASVALKDFFQNGYSYIRTFIQLFIAFVAIICYSPIYGSLAFLVSVIAIYLIFVFDKILIKALNEINEREHLVASNLTDSLSNILTIIILRLSAQIKKELSNKISYVYPPYKKSTIITEWKWFVSGLIINLIFAFLIIGYVYSNTTNHHTFYLGGLITLIGFINQLTSAFYSLAYQYNQIIQYSIDVKTSNIIINESIKYKKNITINILPKTWEFIRIENLNFKYNYKGVDSDVLNPNNSQINGQLRNLNIKITKGRKIALIGSSGSGKTSLLSLLKGLYSPDENSKVFINDHLNFSWESLGQSATLFPQQPEIFENTIRYNITLGLSYDEREIESACRIVGFQEVVDNLPKGLDALIQENGVNLSGGQKQRLALARGYLAAKTSEILLLDEPTSSVDLVTEQMIYTQLFQAYPKKAIISSLHRLHLLHLFDYIYIMREGEVIKQGTYLELKSTFNAH